MYYALVIKAVLRSCYFCQFASASVLQIYQLIQKQFIYEEFLQFTVRVACGERLVIHLDRGFSQWCVLFQQFLVSTVPCYNVTISAT